MAARLAMSRVRLMPVAVSSTMNERSPPVASGGEVAIANTSRAGPRALPRWANGKRAMILGAALLRERSCRHHGSGSSSCGIGRMPMVADRSVTARITWPTDWYAAIGV